MQIAVLRLDIITASKVANAAAVQAVAAALQKHAPVRVGNRNLASSKQPASTANSIFVLPRTVLHHSGIGNVTQVLMTRGECFPSARPARYLCIKYLISSPKLILTY